MREAGGSEMAIKAELAETSRNAAAAGLAALGVAFLLFALAATAGTVFQVVGGPVSGGDVAVLVLAGLAALSIVLAAVLLLRASGGLREGYGEQPVVRALIALGLTVTLLGVVLVVPAFADTAFPGSLQLGTLVVITGILALVAANSYRSVSASVAATGAIFGVAASAVLVSVQVVAGETIDPASAFAALTEPVLVGVVPAIGLVGLSLGGLLRAFLWDTKGADAAHGAVTVSVIVLGLGMVIEGGSGLAALPWNEMADLDVQTVVPAVGLAAGRALFTVAGFLLLSAGGLGFAAASARLYDSMGLGRETTRRPRRAGDDGTNGAQACPSCEHDLPAEAAYCPSCGAEVRARA
jgi:hypothetical protein